MKRIDLAHFSAALNAARQPYHANYFAMYSSPLDGVTTDPALMLLPIDDHLVHRGDGVFETCKCVAGALYNFNAHLERLEHSATAIALRWSAGMGAIRDLAMETTRVGGKRDCSLRIILSRGPGGFGVSPYEPPTAALYIVSYALGAPFMVKHPEGASVRRSAIPPKTGGMAAIKNCNYLPNVLMKMEALDWGVDFVVGYDADGHLTEGATENAGIVTPDGEIVFPRLDNILAGTTMLRLVELARERPFADGNVHPVIFRDIAEEEVRGAREMLIVGTTLNVVAVRSYEGRPIGDGKPGPIARQLNFWLEDDILTCAAMRTPVF